MSLTLSLALALSPAWAGVSLVPSGPIVGDGATASVVRFYVDSGARVRVKADAGKIDDVVVGEDGLVTARWIAPATDAARNVEFRVNGGGEDASFQIPVVSPFAGALALSADVTVVPPGGTALVTLRPGDSSPVADAQRRYAITASSGTIDAPVPAGDGAWVARYTPPKGLTVATPVVIAAVDAAAPDQVWTSLVLPVSVRAAVSFDAKPGSQNVLVIGTTQVGPRVAAPSGKVAFDLDVDPRFASATLKSVNADTSREERAVTLPAARGQILVVPTSPGLPAEPALRVPVRVLAVDSTGAPITNDSPRLTATRGTITPLAWTGKVWEGSFQPPTQGGDLTIAAERDGQKSERRLKIVASVPAVSVLTTPDVLGRGPTSVQVEARVKDAAGMAITGRAPVVTASTGTVGPLKDRGDGSYVGKLTMPASATRVRVQAFPQLESTGMAPARLLALPAQSVVVADGHTETTLTVVALDAYGLPVPNVDLKLAAPRGDGRLPPTARTDTRGIARVTYTSGATPGLAAVHVEGAGLVAESPLWQVAAGTSAAEIFPAGDATFDTAVQRWRGATPERVLVRPDAPPVVTGPAVATVAPTNGAPPVNATPSANGVASDVAPRPRDSGGPARPPRPRPTHRDSGPGLRYGVGLANARGNFSMESDGGAQLVAGAGYASPTLGFFGVDGDISWRAATPDFGSIWVEGAANAQVEAFKIDGDAYLNVQRDVLLGAAIRMPLGSVFAVQGGLGAHYTTGVLFRYADAAKTDAELLNFPLVGARVAVAALVDTDAVDLRLELAETFVPTPVVSHVGLRLDIPVEDDLALRLGGDLDRKHLRFASSTGSGTASTTQSEPIVVVGAAWTR